MFSLQMTQILWLVFLLGKLLSLENCEIMCVEDKENFNTSKVSRIPFTWICEITCEIHIHVRNILNIRKVYEFFSPKRI